MANRINKLTAGALGAALLAAAIFEGTAAAQKDSVPKPQNQLALAEDHVKQVLLLMEADKQGKISKQQFMKFMEAEFERLDTTKTGQLDVKQVTRPTITAKNYVGK
jgi:hypothetical protein